MSEPNTNDEIKTFEIDRASFGGVFLQIRPLWLLNP